VNYHFKDQIPPARKGHTACLSSPDQIIIFGGLQGNQLLGNLALITLKETKCKEERNFRITLSDIFKR